MELKAEPRNVRGSAVKKLREEGLIPAEFYGRGFPNQTLAVAKADFDKVFQDAGESTVVTLLVGSEKHPSIIYDIQRDSISGEIIHADFYGVRMDEKITATVPVEIVGEAPAAKAYGGVLNRAITEIEVEALPTDLPHSLTVDISGLTELDQSVYVRDIPVPKGVEIQLDPETAVATVMPPAEEEEVPSSEEAEVAAVKVESEEKKAERQAEKPQEEGAKNEADGKDKE
jgi:large subunit ribosomal protein L25